ncbi:MAG: acetylornithine deacetylase [Robiginitomaculum sp.]|nr:MAG: acetylornithine deacetylase [Robiginitomaculum sp.]
MSVTAITLGPEEQAIVQAIGMREASMIARVKAWSQVNSGSLHREGLDRQRALLAEAFSDLGGDLQETALLPVSVVTADGQQSTREFAPALVLRQRPKAPIQVVLTGHYDTVFGTNHAFQNWQMLDDDTINGPGTADMKGGLLVMLEALRALEQSPHKDNLGYTVLISPDEEIGSPASAPLLAKFGAMADLGMTYEPALADGSLSGARKGSGNFALIIRGKAAHAGREHHLGRNALVAAASAVQALADLTGQREGLTINPAKIEGGGPSNIVPDLAIIRFNVRLGLPEDAKWAMGQFERIAKEVNALDGIAAELTGGFTRPPKPMAPPNARLFEMTRAAGAALGLEIRWRDTGGVCEGNNLWAAGCPNVDTLGVRGGSIHSAQEFAILSSLVERARLSAVLLLKFASGEFDAKSLKNLTS